MAVGAESASVVMLEPHLDVRTVAAVRDRLHEVLAHAPGDVALDMTGVESIDATGLGMLTALHLRCERAGVRLVLRGCSRDIRRVLAVTRLNRILHVERSHLPLSV